MALKKGMGCMDDPFHHADEHQIGLAWKSMKSRMSGESTCARKGTEDSFFLVQPFISFDGETKSLTGVFHSFLLSKLFMGLQNTLDLGVQKRSQATRKRVVPSATRAKLSQTVSWPCLPWIQVD